MYRIGFVLFCLVLFACNSKKKKKGIDEAGFSYEQFSVGFKSNSLPYQLTDTGLARNKDTTSIRSKDFSHFVPDSLATQIFGSKKVKYYTIVKLPAAQGINYYVVKGISSSRKAALLFVFNKDQFGGVLPLLVPDEDPTTSQTSAIDQSGSITRIISKRGGAVNAEGKEVYIYDPSGKSFSLILTNPLGGGTGIIINPIDTLPRKHKFSGDYVKNKKNFVSIRDGRYANQLLMFIHFDNGDGCTGELKGDLLLTSPTAAIYRQGGDPCVMSFRFSSSALIVKEDEGCGSHRGVDCVFDGTYPRKKEVKPREGKKKKGVK